MAKKNEQVPIEVLFSVNKEEFTKELDTLSDKIAGGLAGSLSKAVANFGKKLGSSIQVAFDDTIIRTLTTPIKITLNTETAKNQIDSLVKPLENVLAKLPKINSPKGGGGNKNTDESDDSASSSPSFNKTSKELTLLKEEVLSSGIPVDSLIRKIERLELALKLLYERRDEEGLFSKSQEQQIERFDLRIKEIGQDFNKAFNKELDDILAKEESQLTAQKKLAENFAKTREQEEKKYNNLKLNAQKAEIEGERKLQQILEAERKAEEAFVKARDKATRAGNLAESKLREQLAKEAAQQNAVNTKKSDIISFQSKLTPQYLKDINDALTKQRVEVSKLGIPLNVINKQTRNYDSTLITAEKNLEDLNREFRAGRISLDDAHKGYEKIVNDLRKLEIGIEQIGKRGPEFKKAFDLEEADPRSLSYRLGILGFTLQTLGSQLTNFSRNFFQAFNQLAQVAEPIERVQNALDLQVEQAEISKEQRDRILSELRDIGDIPGSSVEDANKTFNSLQKINTTIERRLQLTRGLAKLAASPGGEPGTAEQVTNALLNLSGKNGNVDTENFRTVQVQGGKVFAELNRSLGLTTATDLERFGVSNYLERVAVALNNIKSPAETTTDRFNRLKSRFSEMGVIVGKILAPGLNKLNDILKNSIEPVIKSLSDRFEKLNPNVKSLISYFVIGLPVVAGILGTILTTLAAISVSISGFKQIGEISKIVKNIFSFGGKSVEAVEALVKAGPLIGEIGKEAIVATRAVTGLTRIFTGLGGTIAKLLGFTNPIGFIINAIISIGTALYDNFNGIRDRFLLMFSDLTKSLNRFLGLLGYDQNGLLTVLGIVGDALNTVFGFIGEVLLDVVNALGNALKEVIDDLSDMIEAFQKGDYFTALDKFTEFIFDNVSSLLKNLAVELVATLSDAFDALIAKYASNPLFQVLFGVPALALNQLTPKQQSKGDYLRSLIGTDKASVERYKAEKAITDEKQRQTQVENELAQKEEARLKNIEELKNQLKEITEKAKEDFIKFRFEQAIENMKLFADVIKTSTDTQIESFKELIGSTNDLNVINQKYAETLLVVQENQKLLIQNQNKIGLAEALKDFKASTSQANDGFKQIYSLAASGEKSFKALADAISNVGNSQTIDQLNSALNQAQSLGNAIGGGTSLIVTNIIEKTRATIQANNRDTQKYITEYSKVLKELRNLEIDRRYAIAEEKRNIELEAKNRRTESEARLRELRNERQRIIDEREGISDQTKALNERREQITKDYEVQSKKIDDLENQRKKIEDEFRKNQEKGINVGARIEDDLNYANITQQIREAKEESEKLNKEQQDIFSEQNKTRSKSYFQNIIDSINSINSLLSGGLEKFVAVLSRFSLNILPSIQKGVERTGVRELRETFNYLIDDLKAFPNTGPVINVITEELDKLEKGSTDTAESLERVIKALAGINTVDATKARIEQQEKLNGLINDYNLNYRDVAIGGQQFKKDTLNKLNNGVTSSDLSNILLTLGSETDSSDPAKKIGSIITKLSNSIQTLSFDAGSIVNEFIAIERDKIKSGNIDENIFGEGLLSILSKLNAEDTKEVLERLFTVPGSTNVATNFNSDLFNTAVQTYIKSRQEQDAKNQEELKIRLSLLDGQLAARKSGIDTLIENNNIDIARIEEQLKTATGKNRENLIKEQNDIKASLIEFNYQKLDLEETYNIQKAISQAKGNKAEIEEIQKQGKARRELLLKQRNQELIDLTISTGGRVDSKGNILDANGNPVRSLPATDAANLGTGDNSKTLTDSTKPENEEATLTKSERILTSANKLKNIYDGVGNAARSAGQAITDMWNRMASGEGIINLFTDLLGGAKLNLETLGEAFINVAEFAITAFGQALGQAITDTLLNGGNFLKNLKKFFGDILISMGTQLIQMGTIATAIGLLSLIPFFSYLDPDHTGLIFGPIAIAAGIAAILAGKALGGGQSAANTSNTNATNNANSNAGNSGQVDYDPNKDPKLIYQKGLRQEIYLFVKSDDSHIIKAVVNGVNRDPRFNNLIGNRSTGFAL